MDFESIREQYRPERVKLLLVGESPPSNGRFFYQRSAMTTFTSRPFEKVFDVQFLDNQEFLQFFKEKGCFLEDLSHDPVDKLPKKEREERLQAAVSDFAETINTINPPVVAIVLKKIEQFVKEAISESGLSPMTYTLPFPGNGYQNEYIDALIPIVAEHVAEQT